MAEKYNLAQPGSSRTETNAIEIPSISIPKGGGALKGVDEKFDVNPINASSSLSFSAPVASARGMEPSVVLSYSSGSGNGPFGMGWSLSIAGISRKTSGRLPLYRDSEFSDTFVLSGSEDLVPEFRKDVSGNPVPDEKNPGSFLLEEYDSTDGLRIRRYIPRTEGSFSKIECWIDASGNALKWRITSRENSCVLFGWTEESRLSDPTDPSRIFSWMPDFAYDNLGNCIRYFYAHDITADGAAQIYPDKVVYGNRKVWYNGDGIPGADAFFFSTVFNYGQYDTDTDKESPISDWGIRKDVFSNRRGCFEIRTSRLCRSILLFSHMDEIPGGKALLKEMVFDYDEKDGLTLLTSIRDRSFRKSQNGDYSCTALPPLEFKYSGHQWDTTIHDTDSVPFTEGCTFTDLYGEGIPGMLYKNPGSADMIYRSNLGNGHFSGPVSVAAVPNGRKLTVLDLDGDGKMQFASLTPSEGGFYEIDRPADLESGDMSALSPFTPFETLPNISSDGSGIRLIDLNGDGKAEMLVSADNIYLWYGSEGRKGYSAYESSLLAIDEDEGPGVLFSGSDETVFLADMTGDGLVDIVRIRQDEVFYYPNLGYGHFGKKVIMQDAPALGSDSDFNPSMVRLADIDGTGTADLVYFGDNCLKCYLNSNGRAFSAEPFIVESVPVTSTMSNIQLCDITGSGMSSLVWTTVLPGEDCRQIRYVDLMGGVKPYLLAGYSNSIGKEVSLSYTSSTDFYLEDKADGNPWATRIGFPVYCLSKIETLDRISGWRFVTSYRFRDGWYDHTDREFRGFGSVQVTDTEDFEHWGAESSNLVDRTVHQDPVITRIWADTGSGRRFHDDDIFGLMAYDEIENEDSMSEDERHDALRALKGHTYRSETYQDDALQPCSVSASSCLVKMVQPKGQNGHAVFIVTSRQSFTRSFEDNPDDQRISQSINLSYDKYGNVLESVSITYPRQLEDTNVPEPVRKAQGETLICLTKNFFTEDRITDDVYLIKLGAGSAGYELEDIAKSQGYFYVPEDFTEDRIAGHMRLLGCSVAQFFDETLDAPLPFGKHTFPAIPYNSYTLAFTPEVIDDIYGGKLTSDMLIEGKYVQLDDNFIGDIGRDCWWIPSGRARFLDEGEGPEDAKARFYAPLGHIDQFGTASTVHYYSESWMIVSSTENVYQEGSSIESIDFLTMAPTSVRDANGNLCDAIYDENGKTKAMAVRGKGDEADSLDGLSAETSVQEKAEIKAFFSATDPDEITAIAKRLLKKASVRYLYDYDCYYEEGIPVRSATIQREKHYKDDPDSPVRISIGYSNGSGGAFMVKDQAEPDPHEPGSGIRWIADGRTVVNNKGNVVMQYEPYFSDTPAFESDKEIVEKGVTPIFYYDALGRNIRTEYPDGTFDKVDIHTWSIVSYDTGDTVMDSEWYRKRMALNPSDPRRMAAIKSEAYHGTPVTIYLDTLGRAIASEMSGIVQSTEIDIRGNLLSATDARGNRIQKFEYDMLGRPLKSYGPDNGARWLLEDASGKVVCSWNDRGQRSETAYDLLRRPVSVRIVTEDLQEGEELLDNIIARWKYAEDLLDSEESRENLQRKNALGMPLDAWDTAGKISISGYDFNGSPDMVSRRMTKDFKGVVNWTDERLEADLEDRCFNVSSKYDALGRMVRESAPDGSVYSATYNQGGLLATESLLLSGKDVPDVHIRQIIYNEKRQRQFIEYGNGVSSEFSFDPETLRVKEVMTRRGNGSILQDFQYTFDAAGNLSHISDRSQKVFYHNNQRVDPDSEYTYDEFYRLVKASGRERPASALHTAHDRFHDNEFRYMIEDMDKIALRNYSEEYEYDSAGNILTMRHNSDGNKWKREYRYSDNCNRLLSTSTGDFTYEYTYHQRQGFITGMPHFSGIVWDYAEHMVSSTAQVRTDGSEPETTYYQYDGSGNRIRKVTVCSGNGTAVKDERIYIGGYELYSKHSGSAKGLERTTLSIMDGADRFVSIDRRNDIDDGTEKELVRYQFPNHLGSSCMELDATGRIISLEEYTPFGCTAYQAWNKSIKAALKRYRFTGMERDNETGFSHHGARYYLPWLARWLSADPSGISDGLNLYCYCGNNPVTKADITGNDGWTSFWGAMTALGGVLEVAAAAPLLALGPLGVAGFALVAAHGVDQIYHGGKQAYTGEVQQTWTSQGIEAIASYSGADDKLARAIGDGGDLLIGILMPAGIVAAASKASKVAKTVETVKTAKAAAQGGKTQQEIDKAIHQMRNMKRNRGRGRHKNHSRSNDRLQRNIDKLSDQSREIQNANRAAKMKGPVMENAAVKTAIATEKAVETATERATETASSKLQAPKWVEITSYVVTGANTGNWGYGALKDNGVITVRENPVEDIGITPEAPDETNTEAESEPVKKESAKPAEADISDASEDSMYDMALSPEGGEYIFDEINVMEVTEPEYEEPQEQNPGPVYFQDPCAGYGGYFYFDGFACIMYSPY